MKRKIIVPLILASVSATTLGTYANYSVKADYNYSKDTVLNGDLIKISGFQGEGEVGQKITLPEAVVTSADGTSSAGNYKVTVVDPRGKIITLQEENGKYVFTPTYKGYYTVKYETEKEGYLQTVSEELKIYVKGNEYNIALPTNSYYVVPSTVKTGLKIQIPLPEIIENGTESLKEEQIISEQENEGLKVHVVHKDDSSSTAPIPYNPTTKTFDFTVPKAGVYEIIYRYYKNGSVQTYKTDSFVAKDNYKYQDIKLNFKYSNKPTTGVLGQELVLPSVTVFDKNNTSVNLDAYVSVKVLHESGKNYTELVKDFKFTPMDKGKYTVTYKVSIPLFGIESEESTFVIEDVKDNVRPEAKVSNHYEFTTVNGVTQITRVFKDINKNNTFDPGIDVELFNIEDTENKDLDEKKLKEKIEQALGDASFDIPSVVVLDSGDSTDGVTIKVPAIYANDNFSDFSKLELKRYVRTSTGLKTELRRRIDATTTESYKPNEWAECTFKTPGDYTILYEARDEVGNGYTFSYDVKVVSSEATLKTNGQFNLPEIEFPAIVSYAKKNATITIGKVTATDKFDSRVEVRLFYSLDKNLDMSSQYEITSVYEDGKYYLDLSKITLGTANKVYIHAVAFNDYAQENGVRKYKHVYREVNLVNTNDSVAPDFVELDKFMENLKIKNNLNVDISPSGYITYTDENGDEVTRPAFLQRDIVQLPDVSIEDLHDSNLNISVRVTDPYGNRVTVKNAVDEKKISYNGSMEVEKYTYTIKNGFFYADYSGTYTVTYTAKDTGGNVVSKSFGIRVKDTEKPTIILSSYDPFTSAVEVGKFVEVPAATLYERGTILTDITTDIPYDSRIPGKPGVYWEFVETPDFSREGTLGFTPRVPGNYIIKYYGWDEEGNLTESKKYTISATDSIKPTIVLENDHILTNVPFDEERGRVDVIAPGVIELYDGKRNINNPAENFDQTSPYDIKLTVKVYDKNNNVVDNVEEYVDPELPNLVRYKFVAEQQGVYKITYIATDEAGNSTELTKEIKVGDTDAPEVEWNDSEKDSIKTAKLDSYYEFNIDMVTLDGLKTSEAIKVGENQSEAEYKITVNLYDPTTSIVDNEYKDKEDGSYRWKFEKSGTYELRIVAQDRAGNKTTKSYNIVVSEEETKTKTVSSTVGTILIILASLLLVGVVAYFVVTGNKKTTKNTPKSKKK